MQVKQEVVLTSSVVHVTVTLFDPLHHCDTFLLGFVGEHGSESAVSDDPDMGDLGSVFGIDD